MKKFAVILHAEPGTHDALGRALHALLYSQELFENGFEVKLIFDGGGTRWVQEMLQPDHKLHALFSSRHQEGVVGGVCDFCIDAFDGDMEVVRNQGLKLVSDYQGHPSVAQLAKDGFQIVTL